MENSIKDKIVMVMFDDDKISKFYRNPIITEIYNKIRFEYSHNTMFSFTSHTSQRPYYIYKRC